MDVIRGTGLVKKNHLSLLHAIVAESEEADRQLVFNRQSHTEVSSIVWERLVKDEAIMQQPWHHRLQFIRYHE